MIRTTATIMTTPAAGIVPPSRVVDDPVERAAVVGGRLDRPDDLLLGGQEQRDGVQVLALDHRQRGCELVQVVRDRVEIAAHLDQRAGEHRDHDNREHDAEDDECGLAHSAPSLAAATVGPYPSVSAFMYPSWTTASSTIFPSTGAVASSCGMFAVLPATSPATSSSRPVERRISP